jgi:hypothetical protein
MKNIPLSALPNFNGLTNEDPYTFLFEFDILCRSYDYTSDAQKLNLFPATLKGDALDSLWALEVRLFLHGMK